MKTHIGTLLLFLLLISPCAGNAQWVQMPAPPDSDYVAGLVAIDTTLFVLAGQSTGNEFGGVNAYIFRSTDQGASWTNVDTGLTKALIATNPVVVGSNLFVGTAYTGTSYGGLFSSTNNGASWHSTGLNTDSIASVDWLFESDGKLLAVTVDTIVQAFLSTDTGKSWTNIRSQGAGAFAAMDSNLFALMDSNGTGSGVYRSTNNGSSWTPANNGLPFDSTHHVFQPVNALALMGTTLFAGNDSGIFLTTDNGMHWVPAKSGVPAKTSVSSFAVSGTNIFAGTRRGIFLSTNHGTSWSTVNDGLTVLGKAGINGLLVYDSSLFATTGGLFNGLGSVWRRPLSEMIGTNAVAPTLTAAQSLTAYPNPSTQSATINFTAPESGLVNISIVNLLGEEVARLFAGTLAVGPHSFTWDERGLPPGVYECVARMGGNMERVRVVIVK